MATHEEPGPEEPEPERHSLERESQVWFTMLDHEYQSAMPVKWKDLKGEAQDEAMVFRPGEGAITTPTHSSQPPRLSAPRGRAGMDGWTPFGLVKQEQQRRSMHLDSSADGESEGAESEGAVTVGHGRVRQLTTLQVGRHSLCMSSTSSAPTNLQRGLSVRADPVTGGLVGLPESWAGLLPQGLSEAPRSAESVPESLRVASVPEEALNIDLSNPDPNP